MRALRSRSEHGRGASFFPQSSVVSALWILVWAGAGGVAQATPQQVPPPTSMSLIFAPDDYVPLSAFSNQIINGMVTLEVRDDILTWLGAQSATVRVARKNILGLTYFDEPTVVVNPMAGTVTLATTTPGVYVAVSDELVNDFPIVTHWDQSLNGGRGGYSSGATDGIGYRDFNPETNAIEEGGGDVNNHNPAWRDQSLGWGPVLDQDLTHPFRMYQFASDILAVFSDGDPIHNDDAVPAHERYVGECWSEHSVTDLAAVFLSDVARAASDGYPIVHRNQPDAFGSFGDPLIGLREGIPAFQLAHCHLIDVPDPPPLIDGFERSLATYLLPPNWVKPPPGGSGIYPILFTGFYGIHSTTFHIPGIIVIEAIGRLLVDKGHSAMGVMWNGGGSGACQTMHGSAYEGAWIALRDARDLANGDPEKVVVTGGSRGGWTALAVASNPENWPYTVRYAIANNPQTRPGELAKVYTNPAHHIVQLAIPSAAGYHYAWRSDWTGPGQESGPSRAVKALTGAVATPTLTVFQYADKFRAVDSNRFLVQLASEDTSVVIRTSTHDIAKPFTHMVEYYMRATKAPYLVPMKLEIHHRFGHHHYLGSTVPDETYFLDQLFETFPAVVTTEVQHWQRYDPPDHETAELMVPAPDPRPLVLEGPLKVGYGQQHAWTVVGEPGTVVTLVRKHVQTLPTLTTPAVLSPGETYVFSNVTLPGNPTTDEFGTFFDEDQIPWQGETQPTWYWHFLRYTLPGDPTVYETQLENDVLVDTATPSPFFRWPIMELNPGATPPEQFLGLVDQSRTGGVSTEGELAGPPP